LQSGGREAEERLQREKERLQRGLERMQSGDYRVATERSPKDCREDTERMKSGTLSPP
jgi:Tfp pilus assembly protein PilF